MPPKDLDEPVLGNGLNVHVYIASGHPVSVKRLSNGIPTYLYRALLTSGLPRRYPAIWGLRQTLSTCGVRRLRWRSRQRPAFGGYRERSGRRPGTGCAPVDVRCPVATASAIDLLSPVPVLRLGYRSIGVRQAVQLEGSHSPG